MKVFCFIDEITEVKKDESVTAFYTLKGDEEFLRDHFSRFPVMPGVLLLESLKQAAALLLAASGRDGKTPCRLVAVEEAKFGQFVRPGRRVKLFIRLLKREGPLWFLDGRADLLGSSDGIPAGKALTASFTVAHCS